MTTKTNKNGTPTTEHRKAADGDLMLRCELQINPVTGGAEVLVKVEAAEAESQPDTRPTPNKWQRILARMDQEAPKHW